MDIVDRIKTYKEEVFKLNENAKIVAVTKNTSPEFINIALKNEIHTLGENRVQEFLSKYEQYNTDNIHFIGHLQTNKVKYIIDKVKLIQSVDSLKLASVINDLSFENNIKMDILLQINIGNEETKNGIDINQADDFINEIKTYTNINLRGLMCIPPKVDMYTLEKHFDCMNEKYASYTDFDVLSMGMTNDYKLALKHGSNMVRIGSGIFKK